MLNLIQLSKRFPNKDSTLVTEIAITEIQMQLNQIVMGWNLISYILNTLIFEFPIPKNTYFQIQNHIKLS